MHPYAPMPSSSPTRSAPARSGLTGRLLIYTWDRLRPEQQEAAWRMVATMRTTMAREHRMRRIIGLLLAIAVMASVILTYLVLTPAMK